MYSLPSMVVVFRFSGGGIMRPSTGNVPPNLRSVPRPAINTDASGEMPYRCTRSGRRNDRVMRNRPWPTNTRPPPCLATAAIALSNASVSSCTLSPLAPKSLTRTMCSGTVGRRTSSTSNASLQPAAAQPAQLYSRYVPGFRSAGTTNPRKNRASTRPLCV